MKRKIQIIISASAASLLAYSALAQDTPTPKLDRPDYRRDGAPHPLRADRLNGAAKASDIIGMTVENYQGEKLGKVEDVAVDVESGRIVQVILSTGGLIGIGDSQTAVPPGALHHDVARKVLHLDADKAKLSGAPKFETAKWAECCDSNHLAAVYGYYGQEPAFRFIHRGDAVLDGLRNPDGQVIKDGQIDRDGPVIKDTQRNTDRVPNTASTRRAAGTWEKDRISGDGQTMIPVSRLGQVQKASKIMGTTVNNLHNEKLGEVENILLDLSSGRIVALVISSGGFIGIGDELSAVPPTALRFSTDRETLQLDTTKEAFTRAPHFKSNQWPDFGQPGYAGGVYRAYQVEPYFTTDTTTDVDNTRRNVRDRDDQTLTPLDQGNSKADVDTTAQIRKEIIAGKDMSVNAKNVKVITNKGKVTLRGPVNTDEEKRFIGDIANRIASIENVDNQLEVKLNTSSTSK
jgi:sporulation protein YlmC with PRC-barrel domain